MLAAKLPLGWSWSTFSPELIRSIGIIPVLTGSVPGRNDQSVERSKSGFYPCIPILDNPWMSRSTNSPAQFQFTVLTLLGHMNSEAGSRLDRLKVVLECRDHRHSLGDVNERFLLVWKYLKKSDDFGEIVVRCGKNDGVRSSQNSSVKLPVTPSDFMRIIYPRVPIRRKTYVSIIFLYVIECIGMLYISHRIHTMHTSYRGLIYNI